MRTERKTRWSLEVDLDGHLSKYSTKSKTEGARNPADAREREARNRTKKVLPRGSTPLKSVTDNRYTVTVARRRGELYLALKDEAKPYVLLSARRERERRFEDVTARSCDVQGGGAWGGVQHSCPRLTSRPQIGYDHMSSCAHCLAICASRFAWAAAWKNCFSYPFDRSTPSHR